MAGGIQAVLARLQGKNTSGKYADLAIDDDGNLKTSSTLGGASPSFGSGAADATTLRVTRATNDAFGSLVRRSAEMTRGSSTTGYTANQTILSAAGTLLEIPDVARADGGAFYIVGYGLTLNTKNLTPRIKPHIFTIASPTISADYATWKTLYADDGYVIGDGAYNLPALSSPASSSTDKSFIVDFAQRVPGVCASDDTSLYVAFETLDAFTPTSGGKWTFTLWVDQS